MQNPSPKNIVRGDGLKETGYRDEVKISSFRVHKLL